MANGNNKKGYSIRLHPEFKEMVDRMCEAEGVTFNAMIERELLRRMKAYKKVADKELETKIDED